MKGWAMKARMGRTMAAVITANLRISHQEGLLDFLGVGEATVGSEFTLLLLEFWVSIGLFYYAFILDATHADMAQIYAEKHLLTSWPNGCIIEGG
ncbi:MAG: hypothetical protein A2556_01555 [Candidatus Vogelbacteria bacterium RIFOXYD2_FULL_44_9]|uniref:Uncharacterized protein n=1 Tax=Candidatus Vogelbacteria bacterium RIFOXYD2_FULL_44_9 TaxID=1802441 RepID=A0A1G2QPE2_9BACT|nr:MAG: hypothetical protein A2556_01555 [Candidatus Vogelbacteria bacterium RIFOXYD2_FULL_44_9]